MSQVHSAMRRLEQNSAPKASPAGASKAIGNNLAGELLDELCGEIPEDPGLEAVRGDLQAAKRSLERGDQKDFALRFYLTIRCLLREHTLLREHLREAESARTYQALESEYVEQAPQAAAAAG